MIFLGVVHVGATLIPFVALDFGCFKRVYFDLHRIGFRLGSSFGFVFFSGTGSFIFGGSFFAGSFFGTGWFFSSGRFFRCGFRGSLFGRSLLAGSLRSYFFLSRAFSFSNFGRRSFGASFLFAGCGRLFCGGFRGSFGRRFLGYSLLARRFFLAYSFFVTVFLACFEVVFFSPEVADFFFLLVASRAATFLPAAFFLLAALLFEAAFPETFFATFLAIEVTPLK